jgi:CBS domain-containing protein
MSQLQQRESQRVRDVMTPNPITLSESENVQTAAQAMREADVGDVLVMQGDTVRGILTDRDIAVRFVADGRDPTSAVIGEICSVDLTDVSPDEPIEHAMELMRANAIRRLPVVEGGTPVGIVSLGDLASAREASSVLADISEAPANT